MSFFSVTRKLGVAFGAVLACATLSGCITTRMYVDPGLKSMTKADLQPAADPHPAQVLFEFQTKGVPNARVTEAMKPRVIAAAVESGLFTHVSADVIGPGAGTLKIVVNNVPLTDSAEAKGFGTGLTFGLAGSMIKDGYICIATYTRAGRTTTTTLKHAIYTTIGNHTPPPGMQPMDPQSAVDLALDQMTWNAMKQLDEKHAF